MRTSYFDHVGSKKASIDNANGSTAAIGNKESPIRVAMKIGQLNDILVKGWAVQHA